MDLKRLLNLFYVALGIFVCIFIVLSIYITNQLAKEKQNIKKGYANDQISVTPIPSISP
jgi:hypothetical protein